MAFRIPKKAVKALFAIAAVVLAAEAVFSSKVPSALFRLQMVSRKALALRLQNKDGSLVCSKISAACPVNDARRTVPLLSGVPRTGDGTARRFSGKAGEVLRWTDVRWNALARGGTVFVRFRLSAPGGREQRIVWEKDGEAIFGIRTVGGNLEAVFSDPAGTHVLSHPLPSGEAFVKTALVLSPEKVALYVDGEKRAEASVCDGNLLIGAHSIAIGASPCALPDCEISSFAVWTRPLSEREVSRLPDDPGNAASARPLSVFAASAADAAFSCWSVAARMAEKLVPSFSKRPELVPELSLVLSKKDERHFMKAHGESLANGFATRGATRKRKISVVFRDCAIPAEAALVDEYTPTGFGSHSARKSPSVRPAFFVNATPGFLAGGSGAVLLYPPEAFSVFHPDAQMPLPLGSENFVKLTVAGERRGVYVMEAADRVGSAWMATSPDGIPDKKRFFCDAPPTGPSGETFLSASEVRSRYRSILALLRGDPAFPWSRAEGMWHAERHRAMRKAIGFSAPALGALDLKGANLAPMFVTGNLDLSPAPTGTVWSSSRPDIIDEEGRLAQRPDSPGGTIVEMTAKFPHGATGRFRFRVVPPELTLPALFLHVNRPVPREGKTAFTAIRVPSGPGGFDRVERLSGIDGAGIHLRGNTSYITGAKKPLSLEFDSPVAWSGVPEGARHVVMLSGYADPTRLRNAISFAAYRALSPGNDKLSAGIGWCELFFNGEYYGVWEFCPRLCDVVRKDALSLLKIRSPDGYWTRAEAEMADDALKGRGAVQDPYAEFAELSRFVVEAPAGEFAATWKEKFDFENLVDFWLLLNFTGDKDGQRTNQFVMRRKSDGRFLICPWDYDKTFAEKRGFRSILSNPLLNRVSASEPAFRNRCREKWKALRSGPLSDDALTQWIDNEVERLAPFMDEEWHLLPPLGFDGTYMEAVDYLKTMVLTRARLLDSRF